MKITFGLITLNADFFLKQVLESIYPFAHKIIIADGAVTWWAQKGVLSSTDGTILTVRNFHDPENKILLVAGGPYKEKDDQCRAWFAHVPTDTDYVFCVDADEVHSPENMENLIAFLEKEQPTSVGFKSDTFYGCFDRIIGGFERDYSFKRVLKYFPGCIYRTHRQPTLSAPKYNEPGTKTQWEDVAGRDISGQQLYEETGITMWHGSYVSPKGVYNKIRYYEGAVISKGQCIPNYFYEVWLPWVKSWWLKGEDRWKWQEIENKWRGVHEFMPSARGDAFTEAYDGIMPPAIVSSMPELLTKFEEELKLFL